MNIQNKPVILKLALITSAVVTAIGLLIACSSSDGTKKDAENTIDLKEPKNLLPLAVKNNILPSVMAFDKSLNTLQEKANAFCSALNNNSQASSNIQSSSNTQSSSNIQNLSDTQNSWRDMSESWYRLLNYNFGPLNDDILEPSIIFIDYFRESKGRDYTETTRKDIADDLSSDEVLNQAHFNKKLSSKIGILTLEVLLFDHDESTPPQATGSQSTDSQSAILTSYFNNPRKCQLLEGHIALIKTHVTTIKNKWLNSAEDGYQTQFNNNTLSEGDSLVVLFTSLQDYLNHLQARSVPTQTGKLANQGWKNVEAGIAEIEKLLSKEADEAIGVFDFMEAANASEEITSVKNDLNAVKEAIANQDADLFGTTIGRLDGHFKRTVPNSLGITLGLNFSDGD